MEFLKNLDLKPETLIQVIGFAILVVVVVTFVFSLIGSSFRTASMMNVGSGGVMMPQVFEGSSMMGYAESDAMYAKGMPTISIRNISPIVPPNQGGTVGGDAEDFEVRDYSVSIETRDRDEACQKLIGLKSRTYVVFENANESDTSCNYTFKVVHDHVEEVLAILKEMDPRDVTENTYTIKRQLEDFTSETQILEKKLAAINETLTNALDAYDDITKLATKTQDVESLARIIESKIQIIERLTQERLNVNEQLARLGRAKAEQLDRLEYSYFYVTIFENKYIDGEALADSWRDAIQKFVRDVNQAVQNATVNLVSLILTLVPYLIFLFIVLLAAKFGWKKIVQFWQK